MAANSSDRVDAQKKIEDLYKLIDGIDIAMFTTRRRDGLMVSRPMSTQQQTAGTDLWFVTDVESPKVADMAWDNNVNLAYYNQKSREFVSVAGTAIITQDRDLIRGLWKPDWKAWFGDEGGARDGSASDPRLALILVEAKSVEYLVVNKSRPMILFEVAKAFVTGATPDIGEVRTLTDRELHKTPVREAR